MKTLRKQRTISRPAEVTGFGYWSGKDVRVQFRPAEADTGLVFVRDDLDRPRRIPALVHNRIEIPRRTSLTADGATVEMVEHVLAALHGLLKKVRDLGMPLISVIHVDNIAPKQSDVPTVKL